MTWMWNYSKNEVQLSYTKPKITLMTSTYQMAVLMLFNQEESLTFQEIAESTKMPPETLKSVLAILVKAKVLLLSGDTYDINYGFKSKKVWTLCEVSLTCRLNVNIVALVHRSVSISTSL